MGVPHHMLMDQVIRTLPFQGRRSSPPSYQDTWTSDSNDADAGPNGLGEWPFGPLSSDSAWRMPDL